MNDNERCLLRCIAERDWNLATTYAKVILEGITSQTDQALKNDLLNTIKEREEKPFELPYNLKELLAAQDCSKFREDRFLLRESEKNIVDRLLSALTVSSKLKELDVQYVPSLLLKGEPGVGKTLLAKYIAFRTGLPFVYVRFSNLVGSYLGQTQTNIARVFDFVRSGQAVVCFDEIDAIGLARGQKNDVGEMSRIVIALMQELDQVENGTIIIGTTNRADMLDAALLRRFNFVHEMTLLDIKEALKLSQMFFTSVGYSRVEVTPYMLGDESFNELKLNPLFGSHFKISAADVISRCTDILVGKIQRGEI